jgi:hypothetical protein
VFGGESGLEFGGVDLFEYVDELRLKASQYLWRNVVIVDEGFSGDDFGWYGRFVHRPNGGGGVFNQRPIIASPLGRGRCGSSG